MGKIRVYTTPTCPYCRMAKEFLKKKDIRFEDVDVSADHEAAHEMIEKSGQMGVPVIEIGKDVIVGFDKKAIEDSLNKLDKK